MELHDAARRDTSYLHCPFSTAEDFRRAWRWLTGNDTTYAQRRSARPGSRPGELTALDRLFLPRNGYTRDDIVRARAWSAEWDDYRFSFDEIVGWLMGGLGYRDAAIAASLAEEGVTPDQLHEECVHRKTRERRLLIDVARLLPQERAYNDKITMSRLLDDWQVIRVGRRRPIVTRSAQTSADRYPGRLSWRDQAG